MTPKASETGAIRWVGEKRDRALQWKQERDARLVFRSRFYLNSKNRIFPTHLKSPKFVASEVILNAILPSIALLATVSHTSPQPRCTFCGGTQQQS